MWPGTGISETLEKVSVSTNFAQSRLVSVSTFLKIIGFDEPWSRQLSKLLVSISLGLDNLCFLCLADSLSIRIITYHYYVGFI